jgi:precorrin-3B synthase
MAAAVSRTRADRCPGVLRPWPADDGLLVRLRLVGGRVSAPALLELAALAEQYGDGLVHLTSRANLQLRALPGADGLLAPEVVSAVERIGLLPSRSHELARNVLLSPLTGLRGTRGGAAGRADLRTVAAELDRLLCGTPALARLPGRFLFVLDDGSGDLRDRGCDLGLVALSPAEGQLRIGDGWGRVVRLEGAARELVGLAHEFVVRRGSGPQAPWHVRELATPLAAHRVPDPRLPAPTPPLPFGPVSGGRHVAVPDGMGPALAAELASQADELIVTPWRGVLVPDPEEDR